MIDILSFQHLAGGQHQIRRVLHHHDCIAICGMHCVSRVRTQTLHLECADPNGIGCNTTYPIAVTSQRSPFLQC